MPLNANIWNTIFSSGFYMPGNFIGTAADLMGSGGQADDLEEKPLRSIRSARDNQNRSRLSHGEMLAHYDQGISIGEIARRAGVSRQRVHKLAMDNGRTRRRDSARDQRVVAGREALGLA